MKGQSPFIIEAGTSVKKWRGGQPADRLILKPNLPQNKKEANPTKTEVCKAALAYLHAEEAEHTASKQEAHAKDAATLAFNTATDKEPLTSARATYYRASTIINDLKKAEKAASRAYTAAAAEADDDVRHRTPERGKAIFSLNQLRAENKRAWAAYWAANTPENLAAAEAAQARRDAAQKDLDAREVEWVAKAHAHHDVPTLKAALLAAQETVAAETASRRAKKAEAWAHLDALEAAARAEADALHHVPAFTAALAAARTVRDAARAAFVAASGMKRGHPLDRANRLIEAEKEAARLTAEAKATGKALSTLHAEKRAAAKAAAEAEAEKAQARRRARRETLCVPAGTPDAVCAAMEEAAADGLEFDADSAAETAEALTYANTHKSSAWQSWRGGDMPARTLVRCCVGAHRRHETTNYNALLAAGIERDLAREIAEPAV
jgi:hypothetical protein